MLHSSSTEHQQAINAIVQQAFSINGLSDAARIDIISYCREHLNFIPVKEHPANPYLEKLRKPISNIKIKSVHNNNSLDQTPDISCL